MTKAGLAVIVMQDAGSATADIVAFTRVINTAGRPVAEHFTDHNLMGGKATAASQFSAGVETLYLNFRVISPSMLPATAPTPYNLDQIRHCSYTHSFLGNPMPGYFTE